ncbi:MAG: PASTA domain-containing protein [Elusimicrobia bacterium]|nr:PASTA domain-containing protein [Elusimicrobiota bacterium]
MKVLGIKISMRAIVIALIQIVLVLLAIFWAFWYGIDIVMKAVVHNRTEVIVPDVTEVNVTEALEMVSRLGLSLSQETQEFNHYVPVGIVLRQFPAAGTNVRQGKIIRVGVSRGGEVIRVPNVQGLSARSADIALRSANLTVGTISRRYSVVHSRDVVISQTPQSGTVMERGDPVALLISDGLPPAGISLMPDWRFRRLAIAQGWAAGEGIMINVQTLDTDEANPGEIFSQRPDPDTPLDGIHFVTLFVASETSVNRRAEIVFNYNVPLGGTNRRVRLVLVDDDGERDVFNALQRPGSVASVTVTPRGQATMKVFVNNVSVEHRPLN